MPLFTTPGQTWPYTFPSDRALPEATRPTVLCKALSAREGEVWFKAVLACTTYDEADAKMAENIVGVSNMGEVKTVPAMLARLTQEEREILLLDVAKGRMTESQRKNF